MCCSLFNKVGGLKACTFIKKRLQQSCFPREYSKIFKTTFLENTSWTLLLQLRKFPKISHYQQENT